MKSAFPGRLTIDAFTGKLAFGFEVDITVTYGAAPCDLGTVIMDTAGRVAEWPEWKRHEGEQLPKRRYN